MCTELSKAVVTVLSISTYKTVHDSMKCFKINYEVATSRRNLGPISKNITNKTFDFLNCLSVQEKTTE